MDVKRGFGKTGSAAFCAMAGAGGMLPAADFALTADTTVTANAHNFPDGQFGTSLNGQTYQQEALVSFLGYQYAAFFEAPGVPAVARRRLPDGAWQVIRFEDYQIRKHHDAHNVAVIGISRPDGAIHLSYDHHCSDFHYRRSVPGLAGQPQCQNWSAGSFQPTTKELEAGKPLAELTYPMFFNRPDGVLQLAYRLGGSGHGDWYLAEYDAGKECWNTLGMFFSRAGNYSTSASRCAYPNPFRYGRDHRLHVTWCWRERPADKPFNLSTNHDICYAYSEDFGRTWNNNTGAKIAETGKTPIDIGSSGIVVAETKFLHGQMNQVAEYVDAKGRPHAMSWHRSPQANVASLDMNTWNYYHLWRSERGVWRVDELPFQGRKPQIVLDREGRAYVVYTQCEDRNYHGAEAGGKLTVSSASEGAGWRDWAIVWQAEWTAVGEPLLDIRRWQDEGTLSVYLQEKPKVAGGISALHVLDFQPGEPGGSRQ